MVRVVVVVGEGLFAPIATYYIIFPILYFFLFMANSNDNNNKKIKIKGGQIED